jgi:hypothetical protein
MTFDKFVFSEAEKDLEIIQQLEGNQLKKVKSIDGSI